MKLAGGLLLLTSAAASAQWPGDQKIPLVQYPSVPHQATMLDAFIPKEWTLAAKAAGDINGDKLSDAVLVLHMTSPRNRIAPSFAPDTRYDTNPFMLVVALARKGGGYELGAANHALIPRRENPNQEEPFEQVSIANGTLKVKMQQFLEAGGWRLAKIAYTFRWRDGGLKLIGFDRDALIKDTGETEVISINYVTRQKRIATGTMAGDETRKRTVTLPGKPLLDLTQIGDGIMFEPDER
jgi:hypothetical protein